MKRLGLFLMMVVIIGLVSCTTDESVTTGGIYGVVTVKETAEPMRATGVELYYDGSLLLKTVTYDDGHYEFENLSAGEYELKVVASGYVDALYSVVVEAGRTARADMQLERLNTNMTVRTLAATDVGGNKATLNGVCNYGNYVGDPYKPNEVGFYYSTSPTPNNGGIKITSTLSSFNYTINDLKKGTYYYQAYANNKIGLSYGEVQSFEISGLPAVSTLTATNITGITATLNGRIDYEGDPAYTERGFVYSSSYPNPTVDDPTTATTKVVVSGTSNEFSANIAGLTDNTAYYVRAYAISSTGIVYGDAVEFAHRDYFVFSADGIMVQKSDISSGATWSDADNLCASSGLGGYSDWRLPTRGECDVLYRNISSLNLVTADYYWIAKSSSSYYYYFYLGSASYTYDPSYKYRARCIRTLK